MENVGQLHGCDEQIKLFKIMSAIILVKYFATGLFLAVLYSSALYLKGLYVIFEKKFKPRIFIFTILMR